MTTGKRSLRSAALFVTLPLVVSGFGVVSRGAVSSSGNGVLTIKPPVVGVPHAALATTTTTIGSSRGRFSPLFVAAESEAIADELSEGNKKALLSIEKEIEKANKQKEKYP